MPLETAITVNEPPRNTIEAITLSTIFPIKGSIRYYEFEERKPRNLLEQLDLLSKNYNGSVN